MKLLVTGGAGFIGSNFVRYQIATDPSVEGPSGDGERHVGRAGGHVQQRESLHAS